MQNTANDLRVGFDDNNTIYADAKIFDIRIYDKELSQSEINDVVAGNPLSTNLVANYKLQNDVRDYASNGLNGSNNNVTFPVTTVLALESSLL